MTEIILLNQLINSLKEAVENQRWTQVQQIDQQISAQLTALTQGRPLTKNQRLAVSKLGKIYGDTFQCCQNELAVLARKMGQHQRNREGFTAYSTMADVTTIDR